MARLTPAELRAGAALVVLHGSRAFGLHGPSSDVDLKGVVLAKRSIYLGFAQRFETADRPEHAAAFVDLLTGEHAAAARDTKVEGSFYELRRFFSLAADCNPNLLDLLFCREEDVLACSPAGRVLRENRQAFLSQRAQHTFVGYARSQLRRIQTHRGWLLDPPKAQPTRAAFGLPEFTLLPADQLGAARAAIQKRLDSWNLDLDGVPPSTARHVLDQVERTLSEIAAGVGWGPDLQVVAAGRHLGLGEDLITALLRERAYESAINQWRQYQTWAKQRNPERAALEAQHGYDVKHGAHLLRLLRMGRELLTTGRVHTWRGPSREPGAPQDAEALLAVRAGRVPYDDLVAEALATEAEIQAVVAEGRAVVPPRPDVAALEALCEDLIEAHLRRGTPSEAAC